MNPKILLVEDEKKLADILTDYLRQENYDVSCIYDGDEVLQQFKLIEPDAVLLDIMLPGRNGISLCKEIRTFSAVPILMLSARGEEIDRLLGLELGADDYICKPYSPREVVARVKAVMRRSDGARVPHRISWQLDAGRLRVSRNESHVDLTAVEFHLLEKLVAKPGRIFSRSQLMDTIYPDRRIVSDRTIDSHIKKLRKKLALLAAGEDPIQSVYGAGYRFIAD